jgi:hypothetical protein
MECSPNLPSCDLERGPMTLSTNEILGILKSHGLVANFVKHALSEDGKLLN